MLHLRGLKLECLSSFRCLLVLTLTHDCKEVSAEGIRKCRPWAESREGLPKAGEDYEGSKMEVLETMKAAKFDIINNKIIDLKSKKFKYKCFN
jgi:hypothetical protein